MTSGVIKQSIQFTDVYRVMIRPLSGGLESVTRLFAYLFRPSFFMLSAIRGGGSLTSKALAIRVLNYKE